MDIAKFRNILNERKRIAEEMQDSWDNGIKKCHDELIRILTEDIKSTVEFLEKECTADEFSWLSEIFIEIIDVTQSQDFIKVLYELSEKYPEETEDYNILYFIETAEKHLHNK